jgi:hypothetical protein
MNSWGKTNEAYFGDSFDRSNATAAYLNNVTYDNAIAKGVTTVDTGIEASFCEDSKWISAIKINGETYPIQTNISTLQDQFNMLQAQIDDLKKSYTATTKLRSALKTLQYKREVE